MSNNKKSGETGPAVVFASLLLCLAIQCAASDIKHGLESVADSNSRIYESNADIARAIKYK